MSDTSNDNPAPQDDAGHVEGHTTTDTPASKRLKIKARAKGPFGVLGGKDLWFLVLDENWRRGTFAESDPQKRAQLFGQAMEAAKERVTNKDSLPDVDPDLQKFGKKKKDAKDCIGYRKFRETIDALTEDAAIAELKSQSIDNERYYLIWKIDGTSTSAAGSSANASGDHKDAYRARVAAKDEEKNRRAEEAKRARKEKEEEEKQRKRSLVTVANGIEKMASAVEKMVGTGESNKLKEVEAAAKANNNKLVALENNMNEKFDRLESVLLKAVSKNNADATQ